MSGFIAGTPTSVTLQNTTVNANSDVLLAEININNVAFGDLLVSTSTDASSTDGMDVYLVRKVDTTIASNKYQVLSVEGSGSSADLCFTLQAGKYEVRAKNNDATYAGTVSSATLKTYTWG